MTLAELASELGFAPEKVAVERNLAVVPSSTLAQVRVEDGDELENVHIVGGGEDAVAGDGEVLVPDAESWTVAGKPFSKRMSTGTGQTQDVIRRTVVSGKSDSRRVTYR